MSEKAAPLRVEADLKNLARIREFILEHGTAHGGAHKAIMDLITAVDEAVTNIMIHGYRGKAGPVEVGVGHDG
ncbi:MAG: ATP-binding protein, partial [Anaerolineae bacterium]